MDVSIIIVNYNTAQLLSNCITSIQDKTSDISYEIIVVDNNSSDNSISLLKEKFTDIIIVESKVNLGFGKGNNLGAEKAKGNYLFFLNSDTLLINNAIKILLDFIQLDNNKNVACVGGNLYHSDGKPNASYTKYYPSLFRMILYRSGFNSIFGSDNFNDTNQPKKVSVIIGADMLISKKNFNLVSGFDPQYFMYIEESDLQYRFNQIGLISISIPQAKIIHLQGASSNLVFKLKSEITSYFIYFEKFYSQKTVYIYKHIELTFLILRYIICLLFGKKERMNAYAETIRFIRTINK